MLVRVPYKDPAVKKAYHAAYKKRWREDNREKTADQDRAQHANERAAIYGVKGRIVVADVRAAKEPGVCFYCGATESDGRFHGLGIDHVVPLHAGGPNTRENLVACCHACNASKYRGDVPGRWSRRAGACVDCGTTDRKHSARGLCNRCYIAKHGARAKRRQREGVSAKRR
jgi:5-methylcytosine-specific restriction endonuclease McrA